LNLALAILFCAILIPRFSITGAAWAVLLGEVVGFIFNNYFVFKILREKN